MIQPTMSPYPAPAAAATTANPNEASVSRNAVMRAASAAAKM